MKPDSVDYSKLPENVINLIKDVEEKSKAREVEQTFGGVMKELEQLKTQMNPVMRMELENLEPALQPLLETMQFIANKETPEQADYTPVVDAVEEMQKTLSAVIQGIKVNPQVNVAAPNVKVDAPQVDVDLSGVERLLKQLPAQLDKAIQKMPQVEIPEQDNSEVVEKLETVAEWLESIDQTSRMKPQFPNIMKVTNSDGTVVGSGGTLVSEKFDYVSASYPDADTEIYTYKTGGSAGATVATVTVNYTSSTKEFITDVTRS